MESFADNSLLNILTVIVRFMKKSTIIFILLILFGKIYSQEESMKFELPELGVVQVNFKVELPRIKIQNESLVEALMTNIVKESRGHSKTYLLDINEDKQKGCSTIIVLDYMIDMIGSTNGVGFFCLEDCFFIVKGDNPDNLYSIEQEKKYFEYSTNYRNGILISTAVFWDPTQWTFIYEKGNVKLLKCEHFN